MHIWHSNQMASGKSRVADTGVISVKTTEQQARGCQRRRIYWPEVSGQTQYMHTWCSIYFASEI